MKKYHYILSRSSKKFVCPACGKRSFTYYVDADGNILDETVGRCDHESRCGYHYTPSQYFRDHPEANDHRPVRIRSRPAYIPPRRVSPDFVPWHWLTDAYRKYGNMENTLALFLSQYFDTATVKDVLTKYYVTSMCDPSGVIFWQCDTNLHLRHGKIMYYQPDGHRSKTRFNTVEARLKKVGRLPMEFNLVQCLFGEHLLSVYPDSEKTVALVESEKTALIGAMAILKGREVIAFPDLGGGFEAWSKMADKLQVDGVTVKVSPYLERIATDDQRDRKEDIGDFIIRERKQVTNNF